MHLHDAPSTASLAHTASFALPPPSAASLKPINTPRGKLRQITEYATITWSGAPSRVASSTNTDLGNSAALAAAAAADGGCTGAPPRQLSVKAPAQRYGSFAAAQAPADAAAGAHAPGSAPSMAASLAATASFMSETGVGSHLSVRTPRRVYGAVQGSGEEVTSAKLAPQQRSYTGAAKMLAAEPVVTTHEWLTKVMSMTPREHKTEEQPSAMSMLSEKERAAAGSSRGSAGDTVPNKAARYMPGDSLAGTTLFGAFRPDGAGLGV